MLKYLPIFISLFTFGQQQIIENELLWEISGNGLQENSYLFGSLHSNDRRIFNLTDSTYFALDHAQTIILETDVFSLFEESRFSVNYSELNFDNMGEPYSSNQEASVSSYGDEDGMPQFLDAYFQQYCYNAKKSFIPLESIDFQLNLLSEVQKEEYTNVRLSALLSDKEELIDVYLRGDIYDLDTYLQASLSLYSQGYKKVIIDRNNSMTSKLDSILKANNSSVFCAVGAGHLAGEKGFLELLRKKGYIVRKVGATYTENSKEKAAVQTNNSFSITIDSLGLNLVFPGQPKTIKSTNKNEEFSLIYCDFGQGNSYQIEVHLLTEEIGLKELSNKYIASPKGSKIRHIILDNGGEAYEGVSETYSDGFYWTRVLLGQDYFVVAKASGGNKFMNSHRAHMFFEKIWFE